MINDKSQALKILGLEYDADEMVWKSAYRKIAKKCHPDITSNERLLKYYYLAKEAYEFLEANNKDINNLQNSPIMTNSDMKYNKSKSNKIMGDISSYKYNHNDYKKRQKKYESLNQKKKEDDILKLKKNAEAIKEAQRIQKEKDLLNQIRWIRVAEIIHRVIEEDKLST